MEENITKNSIVEQTINEIENSNQVINADLIYKICDKNKLSKNEKERVFEDFYDEIVTAINLNNLFFKVRTAILDSWPNIKWSNLTNIQRKDLENITAWAVNEEFNLENYDDFYLLVKYKNLYYDVEDFIIQKSLDM